MRIPEILGISVKGQFLEENEGLHVGGSRKAGAG